jgi:predicted HTH transcriptional regulator
LRWRHKSDVIRSHAFSHLHTFLVSFFKPVCLHTSSGNSKFFIKEGIRISGSDLAAYWNVSQKTAKRDIADLKQKGLIEFLGAPKNGYYRLKSWKK